MIGLSVSLCIKEIASGAVDKKDVEKIIGGTRCRTIGAWDKVIAEYKKTYWINFPDEAEKLVRQFITEARIDQPRLKDNNCCPMIAKKIWVDSEDEIVWSYQP